MSYGHVRDANVMQTALIAFKYNLKTSQTVYLERISSISLLNFVYIFRTILKFALRL